MKKYGLLFTFLLSGILAFGQTFEISGKILNPDQTPSVGAKVVLEQGGAGLRGAFAGPDGVFTLKMVKPGDYTIKISALGFGDYTQAVSVVDKSLSLDPVTMEERSYNIEEVQIEGEVAQAQQKGDTTQFNAGAFKTNPDANAEDLVQKMPGINMSNGKISVGGEEVKQVLVDGKEFFGSDPSAALRNLPAEVIAKIQVFDQQSDQSQFTGVDDGNTTKTINIITREKMSNGIFGKVYGGYGYDGDFIENGSRYQAGGNLNYFNKARRISVLAQSNNINQQNFSNDDLLGVLSSGGGGRRGGGGGFGGGGFGGGRGGGDAGDFLVSQQGGISTTHAFGLNYSDNWGKKMEVSGSYFFNLTNNDALTDLNRQYVTSTDTGQVYRENSESGTQNINHRLNMRMNYKFTDKTSLLIRPRLSIQQNAGDETTFAGTSLSDYLLNSSASIFSSELLGVDFSNMFLFRHQFEKRGRTISLNVRSGYNENSGTNQLFSALNYFTEPASFDTLDQNSRLDKNNWNVSTNVMYTEPVSEKGMLQLNYSWSPEWNDSEKSTYDYEDMTGDYSSLNIPLSNVFNSTYAAHQLGAGYMLRGKKAFFTTRLAAQWAGLAGEQVLPYSDNVNRTFFNLLPTAFFRLRLEGQNSIFAMYRTSTSPPSISQLQQVIDNSNPLQLRTGNQDLDQSYQHMMVFRYNSTNTEKSRVFFFMLSGNYTQNYVGNSTFIARQDTVLSEGVVLPRGAQLIKPVNLDGNWSLRSFITYGIPVKLIKSNLNFNLSGDYRRTPGIINGALNETSNATVGLGAVLSSNISEKLDFTLSSQSNLSNAINTLQSSLNTRYLNQVSSARVNVIVGKGIVFRSTVTNQLYRGLSQGFDQNFWLWNMGLAKKMFKNQRGELQLSVFDMLKQNNSIQRTVSDVYIEDLRTAVLQRYVMLTFTYNIREFVKPADSPNNADRPGGPGGPGGPEPWRRN
ncbi:MAG: TonB-dependent receptor [Bacteroidia bacterium]